MLGMNFSIRPITCAVVLALVPNTSYSSGDHAGGHDEPLETMREMHSSHDHEHDFGVMDEMTDEQQERLNNFMTNVGLVMPPMSTHRGRKVFMQKGCVVCHSINGVGGEVGPNLDASNMPSPMNAFEFAARMWRGAPAMVLMQEEQLGEFVSLTGEELADLIAFVHDAEEQAELSIDQVPEQYQKMIRQ